MSNGMKNGRISASLLGTFAYCETAALLSVQGESVNKEAEVRMETGIKDHCTISATADRIMQREKTNVVVAAVILFLVIMLFLYGVGRC